MGKDEEFEVTEAQRGRCTPPALHCIVFSSVCPRSSVLYHLARRRVDSVGCVHVSNAPEKNRLRHRKQGPPSTYALAPGRHRPLVMCVVSKSILRSVSCTIAALFFSKAQELYARELESNLPLWRELPTNSSSRTYFLCGRLSGSSCVLSLSCKCTHRAAHGQMLEPTRGWRNMYSGDA